MNNQFTMPLAGPTTYEDAISRLREAELEMEENGGTTWEDVMMEARQRVEVYATAV